MHTKSEVFGDFKKFLKTTEGDEIVAERTKPTMISTNERLLKVQSFDTISINTRRGVLTQFVFKSNAQNRTLIN